MGRKRVGVKGRNIVNDSGEEAHVLIQPLFVS